VSGQKKTEQDHLEMLHQGLAYRSFKQTFNLADHVNVTEANLEHGVLSVELAREIPEQPRPRRIEVGVPTAAAVGQNSPPQLVEQNKAA
jgi:molecular chaperone IbpA